MPLWEIETPEGKTIQIEGDEAPNDDDLDFVLGKQSESKAPDLSQIKLSPYEQADIASMTAGIGKAPTGMEAGSDLTTALGTTLLTAPERIERSISSFTSPVPEIQEYTVPKERASGTPSVNPPIPVSMQTAVGAPGVPAVTYLDSPEERTSRFFQELQKPVVPLDVLKARVEPDDPAWAAAIKEAESMLIGLPEFIESPLGLMTAGVGSTGKAAAKLVRYAFAGDMVKSLFSQYPNIRDNWSNMSSSEKGQAVSQFLGTAAMAGLLAHPEASAGIQKLRQQVPYARGRELVGPPAMGEVLPVRRGAVPPPEATVAPVAAPTAVPTVTAPVAAPVAAPAAVPPIAAPKSIESADAGITIPEKLKLKPGEELKLTIPEYQEYQSYIKRGFTPEESLEMALTISGRTTSPINPQMIKGTTSVAAPKPVATTKPAPVVAEKAAVETKPVAAISTKPADAPKAAGKPTPDDWLKAYAEAPMLPLTPQDIANGRKSPYLKNLTSPASGNLTIGAKVVDAQTGRVGVVETVDNNFGKFTVKYEDGKTVVYGNFAHPVRLRAELEPFLVKVEPSKPVETKPSAPTASEPAASAPSDIAKALGGKAGETFDGRDHYNFPADREGGSSHQVVVPEGSSFEVVQQALKKTRDRYNAASGETAAAPTKVTAMDLAKMTPTELAAWTKSAPYGPALSREMSRAVKPEDVSTLIAERDKANAEYKVKLDAAMKVGNEYSEARKRGDNAEMERLFPIVEKARQELLDARAIQLKAQTLDEMLRDSPKSASVMGGSEANLPPKDRAESRAHNSMEQMAKANGVEFVEGDTPQTILAKINAKRSAAAPAETAPVSAPQEAVIEPSVIRQGPGARTATTRSDRPESTAGTELKHAVDELERVSYGFAERSLPEKQAMAEAWRRAGESLAADPLAGRKLAQALIDNPKRGLTGDESALLLRHKVALENAVNSAAERTLKGTPEERVEANSQLELYRAELNDFLDAVSSRGSEWGREGRWRQAMAYEDYSFATQERLLVAAKGRPLTDTERVDLQNKLAEYKSKFDALEKHQAEKESKAIKLAVDEALARVEKESAGAPRFYPRVLEVAEGFAKYMDGKAESASVRLREKLSRMSAGVDPTIASDVAIIGAAKFTRGAVEFAKWADAMRTDFGPKVEAFLKEGWEEAKKIANAELSLLEKKVGKSVATEVRKKVSEMTADEKIADLTSKIQEKATKGQSSSITPLAKKLARVFVEQGVRGRESIIDSVHGVLEQAVPGMTRSDTMRAIAGYGDYRLLPKDTVSTLLRGYAGEMQQIAKLEDMAAGTAPKKTGVERRDATDEERSLIKQVEEAKKRGGYSVTDAETQLRTAMDAVKARLQNQIADLEKQIAAREKIVKEPTRLEYDAEANKLKSRRDELKQQFDEVFPKQPMTEAERLQLWKERTQRRISELQDMLKSGDIEVNPRKAPVALDNEARKLQADLDQTKDQIQHAREKAAWEKMTVFQKAMRGTVDAYDAARMLMTTGEFSFVLRQGKLTALSRPLITAKALPEMFRAMRNWRTAHEVDLKILNHPDYQAAKTAKLHIIDESASLTRQEEIYAGRWAHALPVVSHFNRAARVFLNKIRFDTWSAMRKSMGKGGDTTPAEDAAIARFVNESTGRGELGFAEQAAVPLGRAFFAPRYTISRFQLLGGHSLWSGSARSRRVIATEYARTLIGLGLYYTMLAAYFGDDDKKGKVTLDPRSSEFGKVRVGNTRIDPLAGVSQAAVFSARTAAQETVTQRGRVIPLRHTEANKKLLKYGDPDWSDVAMRFGRSKLHPIPGSIANLFSGTDLGGNESGIVKETGNLIGPITYFDIYKAIKEQDIPDSTAMGLLAFLGEGLQTYEMRKTSTDARDALIGESNVKKLTDIGLKIPNHPTTFQREAYSNGKLVKVPLTEKERERYVELLAGAYRDQIAKLNADAIMRQPASVREEWWSKKASAIAANARRQLGMEISQQKIGGEKK